MNVEWSELNKKMQTQLNKALTFDEGIKTLLELRNILFEDAIAIKEKFIPEQFCQMPYPKAKSLHNSTMAYSLWHIFRIEDIVLHTLILSDQQVFLKGKWQKKIGAPIITTGNELEGQQVVDFSKCIDVALLYEYAAAVKNSTDEYLSELKYEEIKRRFGQEDMQRLKDCKSVSTSEAAQWLLEYWWSKDVKGLLKMPFSRHWIMHIEAMNRIAEKIK